MCTFYSGLIEAVEYYEEYVGCFGCNTKVNSNDDVVGECSRCGMVMQTRRGVKRMATRVIIFSEDSEACTVKLFNDVILEVVQGVEGGDMKRRLLAAPCATFKIDKCNIALGVVVCSE